MKCWLRISVERGQECITGCFETQSEAHKAGCELWNHDRLVTNVWVESDDGTQHHIIDQYGLV
jgi:hypothetical protein